MRMTDIIRKKRDGQTLNPEEIRFFVQGYCAGDIPDYQASALLMAIYFRGMTEDETAVLTECMAVSGDTVDLSRLGGLSCDKHSTGGVGDKTTLIVAPLVACLGGKVAKMSGRGLGHTGGTVDKLESIPGFRTALSAQELMEQVDRIGVAVVGQTANLTPADKKLYALRDVTATVDSIPLIAASIMSKKLAAGSHSIVLDVKVGSGAFMKTPEEGKRLAEEMVRIGKTHGRKMAALITNMDRPLGKAVGNSLEVIEAMKVLRGEEGGELTELCVALAENMLCLCHGWSHGQARKKVRAALADGTAFDRFCQWIAAQGGNLRAGLPLAGQAGEIKAETGGYVIKIDAEKVGVAASLLGAGRTKKEDLIDFGAGIELTKNAGDRVEAGDTLAKMYTSEGSRMQEAESLLKAAYTFGERRPEAAPLVFDRIG